MGSLISGTDIRYPLPGHNRHPLVGTFAPDLTLQTDQGTTSVAALMHAARPVLLDLADRLDLLETARGWRIELTSTPPKPISVRPTPC